MDISEITELLVSVAKNCLVLILFMKNSCVVGHE
jgi:hypothetical protein